MPKWKAKQDSRPKAVEENAPKQVEVRKSPPGRLWRACSNLSSEGKRIARPGDVIVLSEALAAHYLKSAPGSIEPVESLE